MSRRAKTKLDAATVARIKSKVSFPALIKDDVALIRRSKTRFMAQCPFHPDDTPSFLVMRDHAHCFGCGWHGDPIDWCIEYGRMSFVGAIQHLCSLAGVPEPQGFSTEAENGFEDYGWRPIVPVPADAPRLVEGNGWTSRIFNPKRLAEPGEWKTWCPTLVFPYRDNTGALIGFVLRCEYLKDGARRKFTPTVTFCAHEGGDRRWALIPFPRPRPLYGLERLEARPSARVLLVEGEKTADAAQRLLPSLVAVTWPGGAKAYGHADFSPLRGRSIIAVPDADDEGRAAFRGWTAARGQHTRGILEILAAIGATARCVEPGPALPDGWDLADAEADGWDSHRTVAWIKEHLRGDRCAA